MTRRSNGAGFSELLEHAMDTFTGTIKAGVQFQEDVTRWWAGSWSPANGSMQDWQRQTTAIWSKAAPIVQRNADEYLRLFDANYRAGVGLAQKAIDAGRSESITDAQAKVQQLLDESMETVRSSAKAMAEANTRVMQAWADVVRNGVQSVAEVAREAETVSRSTARSSGGKSGRHGSSAT